MVESCTTSAGNMDSQSLPLRPPVFCPSCGAPHQFYTSFAEQVFLIGRLVYLQQGHRCSTEDASLVIPGTSNCTVQRSKQTQAQPLSQSAELPLACPRAVLVNVLDFLGSSVHQMDHTGLAAVNGPHDDCNTSPYDGDPLQAELLAPNNPDSSKDSSERLKSCTSPLTGQDPVQAQLLAQDSSTTSKASLDHQDEFGTFANNDLRHRDSMPAIDNMRRLSLGSHTSAPSQRSNPDLEPARSHDGDEYEEQVDRDDWSSNASIRGSPAESCTIDGDSGNDDDDGIDGNDGNTDEVVSGDSKRTATPSGVDSSPRGRVQIASLPGPFRVASPDSLPQALAVALAKFNRLVEEAEAEKAAAGRGEVPD